MVKQILARCGTAALAVLLLLSHAHAQEGTDSAAQQLLLILNQSTSMQGGFKQLQYDTQGNLQTQSSGLFKMLRPGYFSWEIQSPDSQLILATPQFIWHLDRDLETLTRRPVNKSGEISPLQILGGPAEMLGAGFDIRKIDEQHFAVEPNKSAETPAGFVGLTLVLNSGLISGMEIVDALEQRIVIRFQNVDHHASLTPADFDFTPPEGVDLFYYDE